eukprot:1160723-Pelagomonas_calceolata.AAC.2
MDASCREKLQEQGIEVPENISLDIPDWAFPNGSGPSARQQIFPDAVFVRPIPGRATHLDPRRIPGHDRYSPCGNLNSALTLTPYLGYKLLLTSMLCNNQRSSRELTCQLCRGLATSFELTRDTANH